jgi:hypothetical protein
MRCTLTPVSLDLVVRTATVVVSLDLTGTDHWGLDELSPDSLNARINTTLENMVAEKS